MIRNTTIFILLCVLFSSTNAQTLINKKYGDSQKDEATAVVQLANGDYVFSGYTTLQDSALKMDAWVMRVNKAGDKVWEYKSGKRGHDEANDLLLTKDGDIIVAGNANSKGWVARLEPVKGTVRWERSYGMTNEKIKDIIQTSDGNFVFVGSSSSYTKGKSDIWMQKIYATGEVAWERKFGGIDEDRANCIIELKDKNLLVAGYTRSMGMGGADMTVYKLDGSNKGAEIWNKTFGGKNSEQINAATELANGQIVLVGFTSSKGKGKVDGQIVVLDKMGELVWEQTYGGGGIDSFEAITKTADGNMVVAGCLSETMWMLKLNLKGEMIWQISTPNNKEEQADAVFLTKENFYVVVGHSQTNSKGADDAWLFTVNDRGVFKDDGEVSVPIASTTPKPTAPKPTTPKPTTSKPTATTSKPTTNTNTPSQNETLEDLMKPNLYILAVGVSDYADKQYNLTFAHSDADSIAEMFATMKGKIFRKVEVKKILNKDATLQNIKIAINWLETQATQKDMVIMFFSSHGALDNKGNLYILPHDFNPVSLFATGLNIKDITSGVNGTPCKKLIFMDACHSGESGNDLLEFASLKDANLDNIIKEVADAEPGISIMTSSSGKEYSYEKPSWGHGAFTKAILEGLHGSADFNKDKMIGFAELNLYVSERVKELTKGKQHPFTPINIFGNIPLFVLP